MNKKSHDRFDFLVLTASRMKMIIHKHPQIEDKRLAQQLGISFVQLQDAKEFCKLNKMKVNEPPSNPVKKDFRKAK